MGTDDTQARLEDLISRLDVARARLDAAPDSDAAVDVLQDLVELAKDVQAEIERQRREGPELRGGTGGASPG